MIDATRSAVSAMKAFEKKLNVAANNVANLNTDGYKSRRATLSEDQNGGVKAIVDEVDTPGIPKNTVQNGEIVETESSNVDLVEEFSQMMTTKAAYKANAKTVQAQDQMLGALFDAFS